jgi:hypothetical protein
VSSVADSGRPIGDTQQSQHDATLADLYLELIGTLVRFIFFAPALLLIAPVIALLFLIEAIGTAVSVPFKIIGHRAAAARAREAEARWREAQRRRAAERASPQGALLRLLECCTELDEEVGWNGEDPTLRPCDIDALERACARVVADISAAAPAQDDDAARSALLALLDACAEYVDILRSRLRRKAIVPDWAESAWQHACVRAAQALPAGAWRAPWSRYSTHPAASTPSTRAGT